jgi:hypothetical protein
MVFSKLEKVLLAKLGLDVVRNPISRKAAVEVALLAARMVAPVTVPAAAALGPALPVALGAGLGYAALQTDPGQQLLEVAAERGRQDRIRFQSFIESEKAQEALQRGREVGTIGSPFAATRTRRRPSSFNKAVKAGMAAVKKSTSYGKKGTISPAKKAFSVVVKLASAKLKKKKAPKSGIRRKIWNAMKGLR